MSFLDMARQRIAMAVKANESAPEPDTAELNFKKGMVLVQQERVYGACVREHR